MRGIAAKAEVEGTDFGLGSTTIQAIAEVEVSAESVDLEVSISGIVEGVVGAEVEVHRRHGVDARGGEGAAECGVAEVCPVVGAFYGGDIIGGDTAVRIKFNK